MDFCKCEREIVDFCMCILLVSSLVGGGVLEITGSTWLTTVPIEASWEGETKTGGDGAGKTSCAWSVWRPLLGSGAMARPEGGRSRGRDGGIAWEGGGWFLGIQRRLALPAEDSPNLATGSSGECRTASGLESWFNGGRRGGEAEVAGWAAVGWLREGCCGQG